MNIPNVGSHLQIFSKEECDQIIEYGNIKGWNEFDYMLLNNTFCIIENDWVMNRIYDYLYKDSNIVMNHPVPMYIMKYEVGGKNRLHRDSDWTDTRKSKYNDRILTTNVLLNDEFKGGELIVSGEVYEQKVGHIFFHHAKIPHEVKTLTEGVRYTLICFIHNLDIHKEKALI